MRGKIKIGIFFLTAVAFLAALAGCEANRDEAFAGIAQSYPDYKPPLLPDPRLHNKVFSAVEMPMGAAVPAEETASWNQ